MAKTAKKELTDWFFAWAIRKADGTLMTKAFISEKAAQPWLRTGETIVCGKFTVVEGKECDE